MIEKTKESKLTEWYGTNSPCLVDLLDNLRLPQRSFTKPLRTTVFEYAPKSTGALIGDCITAKVEAGLIKEKDELLLMP